MTPLVRKTFFALFAAFLSGCGGGSVVLTPPAVPSPAMPVYVFAGLNGFPTQALGEYGPSGTTPIVTLPALGGDAVAVDRSGIIYAAAGTSLAEFAPRTHRLLRTLSPFYGGGIVDIELDAENNLYVVDVGFYAADETPPADLPATVREYAPGSVTPFRTITTKHPEAGDFYSLAIDRRGTLYAGGSNGDVAVIPAGAVHPQRTIPRTLYASALAVDTLDNLYVYSMGTASSVAESIQVFAPGGSTPIRTISGVGTATLATALYLSATNELFASGTLGGTSNTPTVNEYGAESTMLVRRFGTFYNPISIAQDPAGNVYVLDAYVNPPASIGGLSEFTAGGKLLRRMPAANGGFALSTQP